MKKLNILPEEIKKAMIQAYLERCKLKYQLIFAEWRLHTRFGIDSKDKREVTISY